MRSTIFQVELLNTFLRDIPIESLGWKFENTGGGDGKFYHFHLTDEPVHERVRVRAARVDERTRSPGKADSQTEEAAFLRLLRTGGRTKREAGRRSQAGRRVRWTRKDGDGKTAGAGARRRQEDEIRPALPDPDPASNQL